MEILLREAEVQGIDWHQAPKEFPQEMEVLQKGFENIVVRADELLTKAHQIKKDPRVATHKGR